MQANVGSNFTHSNAVRLVKGEIMSELLNLANQIQFFERTAMALIEARQKDWDEKRVNPYHNQREKMINVMLDASFIFKEAYRTFSEEFENMKGLLI